MNLRLPSKVLLMCPVCLLPKMCELWLQHGDEPHYTLEAKHCLCELDLDDEAVLEQLAIEVAYQAQNSMPRPVSWTMQDTRGFTRTCPACHVEVRLWQTMVGRTDTFIAHPCKHQVHVSVLLHHEPELAFDDDYWQRQLPWLKHAVL